MTPGPVEQRLRSRLIFNLTGHWPAAVVDERLARAEAMPMPEHLKALLREMYERAGHPVPPEYR